MNGDRQKGGGGGGGVPIEASSDLWADVGEVEGVPHGLLVCFVVAGRRLLQRSHLQGIPLPSSFLEWKKPEIFFAWFALMEI